VDVLQLDGPMLRQRAVYPVNDPNYAARVQVLRKFLEKEVPNLQLVGRNGMPPLQQPGSCHEDGLMAAWNVIGGNFDRGA